MKGTLTMPHLRTLARLYRADVDGAAAHLEILLKDRWDELAPALGISLQQVTRLLEQEEPAQLLARAIERAGAGRTASRTRTSRADANDAARALANATVMRDGDHHLPITPLRAVLESWRGRGDFAFGDRAP